MTETQDPFNKFFNFSFEWFKKNDSLPNDVTKEIEMKNQEIDKELDGNDKEIKEDESLNKETIKETKVIVENDNEECKPLDCFGTQPNEKYLIDKLKLTKEVFIGIIILGSFLTVALIYWFTTLQQYTSFKTTFHNILIPTIILLCFCFACWFRRFTVVSRIIKDSFIPYCICLKATLKSTTRHHPTAMNYFYISINVISFIASLCLLVSHCYSINPTFGLIHPIMISLFDLIGISLSFLIAYFGCFFVASLFASDLLKTLKNQPILLSLVPAFITACYISMASDVPIRLFCLVFFGICSLSFFVSCILLFPLLFFTDNKTPIDMKKMLLVLPLLICILIVLLLTWIMLFLPGNSDNLPSLSIVSKDEFSREDGIILGGYNKQIKLYSAFETNVELSSSSVDLSQLIVLQNQNTSQIDISGKVYIPLSSQPKEVIFIVHPNSLDSSVLNGYDSIASFFASHNIVTFITNMTCLNDLHFQQITSFNKMFPRNSAELLARAHLLLHHIKFAESIIPNITKIHLVGHGIGANVIAVATRLISHKTLPGFPLINVPQVGNQITSLSFIAPSHEMHFLLGQPISNVSAMAINPLSSPSYYSSPNLLQKIQHSPNTIQSTLSVFGGCSNRFNDKLPYIDDTSKKWETNKASLLSQDIHQLILRNMLASFIFSQTNSLYADRLFDYKQNGFGNRFYVNTFLNATESLFNFDSPFDHQKYKVGVLTNASYYANITSGVAYLKCLEPPCYFNLQYDSAIQPSHGIYLDLTAEKTTTITINFGTTTFNQQLQVVTNTKMSKFSQQQLPLENLLQTYFFNMTNPFTKVYISFNTSIFMSNFYFD